MNEVTFNFHGRFGLRIRTDNLRVLDFYRAEYATATGPIVPKSKVVTLVWRKAIPKGNLTYHYSFHAHKFLARWFYHVDLTPNEVEIQAVGNSLAIPMVHHMLVHPSLRYLCAMDDTVLLHGSAVARKGRSIVFTGPGGTGKTTMSSIMLARGGPHWEIHADDYVFLEPGRSSLAYVTRSHLYLGLFTWLPNLKKRLSVRDKMHVEFFGRLRSLTQERIKWPLRVSYHELWPGYRVAERAGLAAIVVIKRSPIDRPELSEVDDLDHLLEELMSMNFREARSFLLLMSKGFHTSPGTGWEADWRAAERKLLSARLEEAPIYQLELPEVDADRERFSKELLETLSPLIDASPSGTGDG